MPLKLFSFLLLLLCPFLAITLLKYREKKNFFFLFSSYKCLLVPLLLLLSKHRAPSIFRQTEREKARTEKNHQDFRLCLCCKNLFFVSSLSFFFFSGKVTFRTHIFHDRHFSLPPPLFPPPSVLNYLLHLLLGVLKVLGVGGARQWLLLRLKEGPGKLHILPLFACC